MTTMTPRERIQGLIAGTPVDRPAASIWRHFYHRESTAQGLADAMVAFQNRYNWDFMKINPRASYHVEDWGNQLRWSTDEFTKHVKENFAVESVADWDNIQVLSPTAPVLDELLKSITLIRKSVGPDLPLLMTVFTPLSIAGDLVKTSQTLLDHLAEDRDKVVSAIERITETFCEYSKRLRDAGADGLFFATTQWASRSLLRYDEYEKLGRKYDLPVLESAGSDALNLFHVCEGDNYLKELSNYPAQLINWDEANPTNLSLAEGIAVIGDKVAVGGLDNEGWLLQSTPEEIEFKTRQIFHTLEKQRFIFGPGCSIPPETPHENLAAVATTVQSLTY